MGDSEQVDIRFDSIVKETDKAMLIKIGDNEYWLPKSQITVDGDDVSMPEWLAIDKGLV